MPAVEELKIRMDAFSLWLASQDIEQVAETLSIPIEQVESWSEQDNWQARLVEVSEEMYKHVIADYSATLFKIWRGQIDIAADLTEKVAEILRTEWASHEFQSRKEVVDTVYKFTNNIVNLTKFLKTYRPSKLAKSIDGVDMKLLEEAISEQEDDEV